MVHCMTSDSKMIVNVINLLLGYLATHSHSTDVERFICSTNLVERPRAQRLAFKSHQGGALKARIFAGILVNTVGVLDGDNCNSELDSDPHSAKRNDPI